MILSKLKIPFSIVVGDAKLCLLGVTPYYKYEDGKKTEVLEGYKYQVVELITFEKFSVKIPSKTPMISNEEIAQSKERIFVAFDNAIAKPYKNSRGDYDLSISASGINQIK